MAKIGRVKLGGRDINSFIDMSHDVNTTCSFGFFEPTMCLDVIPEERVSIKASSGVRLAPLPQPTTGLITLKNYYSYVKIEDVFPAFENLQSQTSVNTSRSSYIPNKADTTSNFYLFYWLLCRSVMEYKSRVLDAVDTSQRLGNAFDLSQFFTFSLNSSFDCSTGTEVGTSFHNMWEDVQKVLNSSAITPYETANAFFNSVDSILYDFTLQLAGQLGVSDNGYLYNVLSPYLFANYEPLLSKYNGSDPSRYCTIFAERFCKRIENGSAYVYSQARSVDNADFYFYIKDYSSTFYYCDGNGGATDVPYNYEGDVCIGIHLTPAGKRLFKIFNAIGVNFRYQENVEMTKLYAYYKAWFDIFNPGRNRQWKDTACYGIIQTFFDEPDYNIGTVITDDLLNSGTPDAVPENVHVFYDQFFMDLVSCFYSERQDPITVATASPVSVSGGNNSFGLNLYTNSSVDYELIGDGYGLNSDDQGGLNIRFLNTLYKWVNKNTVIGQKVAEYMRVHFGVDVPRTSFIDKHSFDVNIVDAVATVNNDQTALGEYGGLGRATSIGDIVKITAPKHGYVWQFVVVVPRTGYVQAGVKAKVNRFDWWQPDYDSLGMEPLSIYEVNSRCSRIDKFNLSNPTFGFRPRYFSLKYKNNLANGDFSFRSQRSALLGYSLDRLFTEPDVYMFYKPFAGSQLGFTGEIEGVSLAPDEELRYIGKNESFGNYNRIFYDTTGVSDNFIVFIHNDVKTWSKMKPISDSFEAFDDENDTGTSNVEHA